MKLWKHMKPYDKNLLTIFESSYYIWDLIICLWISLPRNTIQTKLPNINCHLLLPQTPYIHSDHPSHPTSFGKPLTPPKILPKEEDKKRKKKKGKNIDSQPSPKKERRKVSSGVNCYFLTALNGVLRWSKTKSNSDAYSGENMDSEGGWGMREDMGLCGALRQKQREKREKWKVVEVGLFRVWHEKLKEGE